MSLALQAAALTEGRTVQFRPSGTSMAPRVRHNDLCTVEPLAGRIPRKRDVVLCKVNGSYYLHLVSGTRPGQVQISNNKGRVNGWTTLENVFGILVENVR